MPATKKPAKKPAVKKAPARKATTTRTKKKANDEWTIASSGKYESFKLSKGPNFFSTKITDQTVYWAILGFLVLAIGIWVITINDKVQYLYDQIDAQNAQGAIIAPVSKN